MYFFFKFFKNEENLKKNTSTSGCIEKYISLVKMYKKICNRKIELKKKIIWNITCGYGITTCEILNFIQPLLINLIFSNTFWEPCRIPLICGMMLTKFKCVVKKIGKKSFELFEVIFLTYWLHNSHRIILTSTLRISVWV